jgi:hypothetical protein
LPSTQYAIKSSVYGTIGSSRASRQPTATVTSASQADQASMRPIPDLIRIQTHFDQALVQFSARALQSIARQANATVTSNAQGASSSLQSPVLVPIVKRSEPIPIAPKLIFNDHALIPAQPITATLRTRTNAYRGTGVSLEPIPNPYFTPPPTNSAHESFTRKRSNTIERVNQLDKKMLTDECGICYENLNGRKVVRKLNCQHIFHQTCLFEWLKKCSTCPFCRTKVEYKLSMN